MAIDASTIWEFRATNGAATNGGGFADLDPGTSVDYSDQNAAELTITDGATAGIDNTTLTSANGGFTAAMAGNVIYLQTGTNLTDGWYQITVYTDTNTVTLDRAPDDGVGGVSGADGEVGGALDVITGTFLDNTSVIVAGQIIYVKNDGTMTLTGAVDVSVTIDGTSALLINLEGYNSSRGDNPTFTNRPLIVCAANDFKFGISWAVRNLRITTTTATGLSVKIDCVIDNCDSNNASGAGNRNAISASTGSRLIGCEGQAVNGYAFAFRGRALGCYAHDSVIGMQAPEYALYIINCVIDTCTTGIDLNDRPQNLIVGNTIYNCGTGISGNTAISSTFLNNIIDVCTTGASWTNAYNQNWWDYNCWGDGNTVDTSNVTWGDNRVEDAPAMGGPAGGDFSIQTSSPCADKGLDAGDLTGATV